MSALAGTMQHARYVIGENPVTGLAFALFMIIVIVALLGPHVAPIDPLASDTAAALQPPSLRHWFGTDQLGRDIFSRVVVATRLDFGIVIATAVVNFPLYVRVARAEANVRRETGFVEAARLSGNSEGQILVLQVLPN